MRVAVKVARILQIMTKSDWKDQPAGRFSQLESFRRFEILPNCVRNSGHTKNGPNVGFCRIGRALI